MPQQNARDAYADLIADPQTFLQTTRLTCTIFQGQTGLRRVFFEREDQLINGHHAFSFYAEPRGVDYITVNVFFVETENSTVALSRNALETIPFPNPTIWADQRLAPRLMITAPLSGCSFVYYPMAPLGPYAAHLKPTGTTGRRLEEDLKASGFSFRNLRGKASYFGKLEYPDPKQANVIGVNSAGQWRFFSQVLSEGRADIEGVGQLL